MQIYKEFERKYGFLREKLEMREKKRREYEELCKGKAFNFFQVFFPSMGLVASSL